MANRFLAVVLMLAAGPAAFSSGRPAPGAKSSSVAATPAFGMLSGRVTDTHGAPQMGAQVTVLAADGRVLHRLFTNELGTFVLDRVLPGVYGLKVTLASFLPSIRDNVTVQPGSKAFLSINLASLTDSVGGLMGGKAKPESDNDWKWVVRSAGGLRPVLRLLPTDTPAPLPSTASLERGNGTGYPMPDWRPDSRPDLRPDLRARVEFNGGGSASAGFGGDAGMSTNFSLAQSLFADTTLLLGGNLGFERATPASAFRGVLRREQASHGQDNGESQEMSFTLRQIELPGGYFARGLNRADNFLSMSADFEETLRLLDTVSLVYGASYDSVDFLGHVNSVNPRGRLIAKLSPKSTVLLSYSQGPERQRRSVDDPLRDVASQLSAFPQMTMRDGAPAVERDRHAEVSYRRKLTRNGLMEAAVYHDQIDNFAIGVASRPGEFTGDLLPDVFSNTASLNGGNHQSNGARLAWEQSFGDRVQATASYTVAGLPVPVSRTLNSDNLNELRDILQNERRHSLALRLGGEVPGTKTRIITSYKWVSGLAVLPRNFYSDSIGQIDPNFNILIRQPLPQLMPFFGRVEALADFRNLLSQGYIPLTTADGKSVVLLQNVRTFRGGLSFNF